MHKDTSSQAIRDFLRRANLQDSPIFQDIENAKYFLKRASKESHGDRLKNYDFAINNLTEALKKRPSDRERADICDVLSAAFSKRGLTRQKSCPPPECLENEYFMDKLSYMADLQLSYQYLLERNRILEKLS